jgi:hypothetical protein
MARMAGLVTAWDAAYLRYLEARASGDREGMAEAKAEMDRTMADTLDCMQVIRVRGVLTSIR